MTRPCSFIQSGLAVFLFYAAFITGPTLLAADDGDSTIAIHNPLYLPPGSIACERIPLGQPDDYKACIARMPDG